VARVNHSVCYRNQSVLLCEPFAHLPLAGRYTFPSPYIPNTLMKNLEAAFSWHNQEMLSGFLRHLVKSESHQISVFLLQICSPDKLIAVVVLLQVSANPF